MAIDLVAKYSIDHRHILPLYEEQVQVRMVNSQMHLLRSELMSSLTLDQLFVVDNRLDMDLGFPRNKQSKIIYIQNSHSIQFLLELNAKKNIKDVLILLDLKNDKSLYKWIALV